MKELLREAKTKREKISEDRDSYKIAFEALIKELDTAEFNSSISTHGQPDDNSIKPGKIRRPNSKTVIGFLISIMAY